MSTAESAGRPVRPAASSSGSASRAPYADGGSAGVRGSETGALRRMADGDAGSSSAPTTPVPVAPVARNAPATASPAPAAVAAPAVAVGQGQAQAQSAPAAPRQAPRPASARRVRLTVSRVDPWSAMKIAFLLSVALGIAGVVMVFVLWTILAGMGVFDQINGIVGQVVQDGQQRFDIMDFIGLGRVLSLSIVIAVIDVILVTAIATLAAFLYNVSSALVGGVQLTLTDD
ncbi:MAG TPA: DUF3566 domain-containing protein [Ornithinibacter sp.]|nr:DUF3566 domain-containing protein [Ornithinibacter sp.]